VLLRGTRQYGRTDMPLDEHFGQRARGIDSGAIAIDHPGTIAHSMI